MREANFAGDVSRAGPKMHKRGKRVSQDALKKSKLAPRREKDSWKDVFEAILL